MHKMSGLIQLAYCRVFIIKSLQMSEDTNNTLCKLMTDNLQLC